MLTRRSAALTFIFVTVLLDMIALGIIIPVFQPLLLSFTHGDYTSASIASGAFSVLFALVQFFASPILGTLSDRVGRRPVVLLSNLGTSLDYVILAVAPNLGWLLVSRVLAGGTTASIAVASAYIADVTPEDKRAGAYGMLSAAFGAGFVIGPAIGGLLGAHGLRLPFWVAAVLSLINFVYGLLVLPESLAPEHRSAFSWARANPLGSLKLLRRHAELAGLSLANLFGFVAHEALPQLFVLYALYSYGWTQSTIGLSLAVVGVLTIVISALVVQRVVNRFGERRAVVIGLFLGALGYALFAGNQIVFWAGIVISMFWTVGTSASQALMTRRVEKHEQGELQGAINLLRSAGTLVGPLLFAGIFSYSVSGAHGWKAPGAAWFAGSALLLISLVIAWRVTTADDDVRAIVDTAAALESSLPAETPLVD
ncbi:MAG TPA: TCR/Tet family MFS transporter [Candidatus Sulfotelmatobacter sp.]|nr:TCR/Tet family MFS transporter [Candidatus Sulfotelmatobacter sp.]